MKSILIGLIAILTVMPLCAQIDLPKPSFSPYANSSSSLLSLNRLSMKHSMGFSAGMSSSGPGYYISRYTNHLRYDISSKLDLELDLNFVNFGTTGNKLQFNDDNRSKIIPEFRLSYRPTDSVNIQVEFRQGAPWYLDQKPWYERW